MSMNTYMVPEEFLRRSKEIRDEFEFTSKEGLGDLLGRSRWMITQYERGRQAIPYDVALLVRILSERPEVASLRPESIDPMDPQYGAAFLVNVLAEEPDLVVYRPAAVETADAERASA